MPEFISILVPGKSDRDVSVRRPLEDLANLKSGNLPEGSVGFRVVTEDKGKLNYSPRYFVDALLVSKVDSRVTEEVREVMGLNGINSVIYTCEGRFYAPLPDDIILN